jgi:hypothetical protein
MHLIPLLDKLKVGGELIKTLYLSILEEIRRKELLDNFNELSHSEGLSIFNVVLEWETGVIEFEVLVDPEREVVALINSDVVVRDEEIAVVFEECAVGAEELNGVV